MNDDIPTKTVEVEAKEQEKTEKPIKLKRNTRRALLWLGRIIRFIIVVAVLGTGGLISVYWLKNRPKTVKTRPEKKARLVEVEKLTYTNETAVVKAMGTVIPARTAQLSAQVGGRIEWLTPKLVVGGLINKGEVIASIEKRDFELAVEQRKSDVAKAESAIAIEMGQQAVAAKSYELLGKEVNGKGRDLVLRKPQLEQLKAALKSAEASLEDAKLDLVRTTVKCPFDCVVQSKYVEQESIINPGTALTTLIDRSEYWIEVLVSSSDLSWIAVPEFNSVNSSEVKIYSAGLRKDNDFRKGKILRIKPNLDIKSRMAGVIIQILDPLDLQKPLNKRNPLVLDSYVRTEIYGMEMKNVVRIARDYVKDGNRINLMTDYDKLEIVDLNIVWSDAENVYVKDCVKEGAFIVITDIGNSPKGMALRTLEFGRNNEQPQEPKQHDEQQNNGSEGER